MSTDMKLVRVISVPGPVHGFRQLHHKACELQRSANGELHFKETTKYESSFSRLIRPTSTEPRAWMLSEAGAPLFVPSSSMKIVHGVGQGKHDIGSLADKHAGKGFGVGDECFISNNCAQTPRGTKPRDDQFYLRSAIFEVEDVLFQLPIANFVRESEVFKTLFDVPQPRSPARTHTEGEAPNGDDDDVEGATDANPIRLAGVKKEDFRNLVKVMYARAYADEEILSEAQWTSVLVLSERWDMPRLQALAIAKLTPALARDPHKMAAMGRTYDVSSWLISGIHALVVRPEPPMGLLDAQRLGVEEALKVAAIREWTLRWKLVHRDSTEWILNRQEMPPLMRARSR